ncbi:MAG: 4Fe-4S dicluster domain-containing protein [Desulfurococcales archaeon]|nr:4Fe-4S dicluster domain-containing protein [Desulfurococcales archaeon]
MSALSASRGKSAREGGRAGCSVDSSRREFIKAAAIASGLVLAGSLSVASRASTRGRARGRRFAMFIDVDKCYGCYACVVACAHENNVPVGVFRTWVERYVKPDGTVVYVPKQCNHCDNPSCVEVCPVNATYVNEDGIVLVNDDLCIGCGACIENCPYGARFFNPVKGVADKCTFCDHRIYQGLLPACVEACPTGARVFGPLSEEDSEVSVLVRAAKTQRLKEWTGNEPQIYYKDLPAEANT